MRSRIKHTWTTVFTMLVVVLFTACINLKKEPNDKAEEVTELDDQKGHLPTELDATTTDAVDTLTPIIKEVTLPTVPVTAEPK